MRLHEIHARDSRLFAPSRAAIASMAAVAIALALAAPAWANQWFTPPGGWQAVTHPRELLGAWVHPGDTGFRQNIVAGAERTSGSAMQWDEDAIPKLEAHLHQFVLGADSATTTCGRPAHYLSYASIESGHKIIYEHMTTVVSGVAFFVIYARLATQPSLPEARAALTTLCGAQIRQAQQPVQQQPAPAPPPAPDTNTATPTPAPAPAPTPTFGY
jgi:hypothetical protein